MTIKQLKESNSIIFECVCGSKAYGLATETSDTDIKGVFIIPQNNFYSLEFPEQINDENNNVVYYELRKFIELLSKNNPNMLEMLNMPDDCIRFKHTLYDKIKAQYFLSNLCKDTFAGYAMTQLKKARGLNKKILNPINEEKKSILDFCYVQHEQGAISLENFLQRNKLTQENCGLVAIPHMREMYAIYYNNSGLYNGIIHGENSLDVALSSVQKGEKMIGLMSFNKDGYSKYCKDYKEYWDWVENRNDVRFQNTISHGKNYDAKNMMHTFRLLDMAEEIGRIGQIIVRRSNREILLNIKRGDFDYETLMKKAEERLSIIEKIYEISPLPSQPDLNKINDLLVNIRTEFYF